MAKLEVLAFYVKNFGVRQGFEMYKYLGVENLPNGVISWLQADMADGDSSVDDLVEGGYYTPKNKTTLWVQRKYVTEYGLNTIKQHLSGDLADEFNDAMISRLENAYANNTPISGADLDFYVHEIYESTLMKNGMNYNYAHEAAKAYYNATEFNLYHSEVIKTNPKLFNNAWLEFWGIERD